MFQISALHQSNYDNYVSDFGDPMLVLNLHCCLMCQESVTCDAEDISEHLNIAHALSLEDYHDRYIANDRTVSTAKKQNSLCRNWDKHHGKLIINKGPFLYYVRVKGWVGGIAKYLLFLTGVGGWFWIILT